MISSERVGKNRKSVFEILGVLGALRVPLRRRASNVPDKKEKGEGPRGSERRSRESGKEKGPGGPR